MLILLLLMTGCSNSNRLAPSLIAPIKIIDLKLDKKRRLSCDNAVLWAREQLPHITDAQQRFKKLRADQ